MHLIAGIWGALDDSQNGKFLQAIAQVVPRLSWRPALNKLWLMVVDPVHQFGDARSSCRLCFQSGKRDRGNRIELSHACFPALHAFDRKTRHAWKGHVLGRPAAALETRLRLKRRRRPRCCSLYPWRAIGLPAIDPTSLSEAWPYTGGRRLCAPWRCHRAVAASPWL